MPKEITHILIAQEVLAEARGSDQEALAKALEENRAAFYLGAVIPDALFYDLASLGRTSPDCAEICRILHSKDTAKNDQKATGLFDAIAADPARHALKAAFAAGIVTHTVSDRMIHRIVNYYVTKWDQTGSLATATHRELETLIDVILLQQSNTHPRDFQLEKLIDVYPPTKNSLFRFYLANLMQDSRPLRPRLLHTLKRAHGQQVLLLRLFRIVAVYHIVNLINNVLAGRLGAWSSLLYPKAATSRHFPSMKRLNLDALTDGHSFKGDILTLMKKTTESAFHQVRTGFGKLEP